MTKLNFLSTHYHGQSISPHLARVLYGPCQKALPSLAFGSPFLINLGQMFIWLGPSVSSSLPLTELSHRDTSQTDTALPNLKACTEVADMKGFDHLFRITEVFLRDDGHVSSSDTMACDYDFGLEPTDPVVAACDNSITNVCISMEEQELVEQMDALGLPLSFGTSKGRNVAKSKDKRKGGRMKYPGKRKGINDKVSPISGLKQIEGHISLRVLHDDTNLISNINYMKDHVDTSYCDTHNSDDVHSESTFLAPLAYKNESCDKPIDEFRFTNTGNHVKLESPPDNSSLLFTDVWNSVRLHRDDHAEDESTWFPPSSLKKHEFSCNNTITKENCACDTKKYESVELAFGAINEVMDSILDDELCEPPIEMAAKIGAKNEFAIDSFATGNEGSITQLPFHPLNDISDDKELFQGMDQHVSSHLAKYWCQRYLLFTRYDDGIQMDEEGWFSVTPELIAKHHAFRCDGGTVVDCFTGVGGNAIQFAMRCNHVIAIDIDPQKICYAQHNAAIYGVSEKIDFLKGDFFELAPRLKGDVVFLSPPWGGPDYAKMETYDLRSLKPHEGCYLFKIARTVASKVVMFLPRSVNLDQLVELSMSVDPPWSLEVEKNYLNGKLKAVTAYFCNTTSE
ncbi:hypothetical protein HPP92_010898 [Vanilla planifolia]|uniref:Trimethylguanosine synthase n=1 Tax=Vanilla planifolia TaxID=51239 RepID=A0A835V0I9_VANPL|nr:hypothetical protein HPP92_010898 [Vanilla planifolia]